MERPELGADDLESLAEAMSPDAAVMMWLGAALGLRWAEVAGLSVDRLDLLAGTVTVDRQLTRERLLAPPKSEKPAGALSQLLHGSWRSWRHFSLGAGLSGADGPALVFVNRQGGALDYSDWRRRQWIPGCDDAGLVGLRFHDLRSLAATALVAAGVDIKTTRRRLWHSSPHVTLALYARATAVADRRAAELVGERLRPGRRRSGPRDGGR